MAKRVLCFGITGIDKGEVLSGFAKWSERYKRCSWTIFNFERDFLFNEQNGGMPHYQFLRSARSTQYEAWQRCWARFANTLEQHDIQNPHGNILISLHGCFVWGHYGARTLIRPEAIAKLRADKVVTLIDDVYDLWWRTQHRARGRRHIGMPTLDQLLLARRVELIIADQVAYLAEPTVPHLVLSVHHPRETLWNWTQSEKPKVVYLSFPISAPRKLQNDNDTTGIEAVNDFIRQMYDVQDTDPDMVMICPLTIDELPLLSAIPDVPGNPAEEAKKTVVFDRESVRWEVGELFSTSPLATMPVPAEKRNPIPVEQIRNAAGMIKTDVGWRDFRLIDQSKCLAVFNPKFKNKTSISRGVGLEIEYASVVPIPTFIYQDPEHDPDGIVYARYFREPGTMGTSPSWVEAADSVSDLISKIT